ncbi:MAG TPA: hypothetical protein VFS21_31645 [Roseiflexaceae bacterium]|nr:hypothetical protein [Roseiflexaceae bacterium]
MSTTQCKTIISLQIGLGTLDSYADLQEATQAILRGDGWQRIRPAQHSRA